ALLDITQRARFEAMPVQRANEGQQVDMRGMRELARHARHHPTRAQHRKVERPSVESRHPSGRLELLTQGMQKRRFHPRLRQEDLSYAKTAVDRCRDSRGEHVGARSAREAGRFGVEVRDKTWVGVEWW